MYPDFEVLLADIFKVPVELVTVYSAMEVRDVYKGVDIWFSIIKKKGFDGYPPTEHAYYGAMYLISVISVHKTLIEKRTGKDDGYICDNTSLVFVKKSNSTLENGVWVNLELKPQIV